MATLRSTGSRSTRIALSRLSASHKVAVVVSAAIIVGAAASQYKAVSRALLGVAMLLVFGLIAMRDRKLALVLVVVGLVLLGFVRRLLIPFAGWNPQDPLLLVSPACATILWLQAARGRALPRSALASIAFLLLLWAGAETLNPAEPSLVVGIQAALFWMTPFLWFFAGRALSEEDHDALLKTVFWVGLVVVAHGLYQTFVGLLPFEYTWLDFSGPGEAIFLSGFRIRPFSTLVSPQEYGFFMGLLTAIILARILHGKRVLLAGAYFLVAVVALFLQGTRQVLALFVLSMGAMVILRMRSTAARVLVVSSAVFLMFTLVPRVVQPSIAPPVPVDTEQLESTASLLTAHQIAGFTDPMNSTLPLHLEMMAEGFKASFSHPFGVGIGMTSIAASKAGLDNVNTENDVSSVFAGLGFGGGVLYVVFILVALLTLVRLYLRERTAMHLAWVGMAIVHLTQWWSGTLYATTSILFLALGGAAAKFAVGRTGSPAPAAGEDDR